MLKSIIVSIVLLFISFYIFNNNFSINSDSKIKVIPRNELYYTQGIFFDTENTVIESGGLYGESVLVRMEYPSMMIIKKMMRERLPLLFLATYEHCFNICRMSSMRTLLTSNYQQVIALMLFILRF